MTRLSVDEGWIAGAGCVFHRIAFGLLAANANVGSYFEVNHVNRNGRNAEVIRMDPRIEWVPAICLRTLVAPHNWQGTQGFSLQNPRIRKFEASF